MRIAKTMQVAGAFIDRFRYYSKSFEMNQPLTPVYSAASALAPESLITGNVIRQPAGVVACITPTISPGERCRKDSSSSGNGEYGYHQTSTSRSASGHKVRRGPKLYLPSRGSQCDRRFLPRHWRRSR